jgi:hypothetical protein
MKITIKLDIHQYTNIYGKWGFLSDRATKPFVLKIYLLFARMGDSYMKILI